MARFSRISIPIICGIIYPLYIIYYYNGITKTWNEVDGEMVYFINMPGFKNALATIRKFYQDGLIEPEYALMNRDQFLDKLYTNVYGAFDYTTDLFDPNVSEWTRSYYEAVPEAKLTMVPPFKDANGEAHMRTINQSVQFVVFDGAEHSENAIKLINYLATEEGMLLAEFGIEGEHWVRGEDGKPVSLLTTEAEKTEVGTGSCAWVHRLSYFNAAFSDAYDAERAIMKDSVQKTYVMPTTESYKDNSANLSSIQSTYFAEIVCNPDIDFDATVEKYIKEWNEAGGAEWTEEINEYWASRK